MKTTLLIALILVSSVCSKQFEGQFVPHGRNQQRAKENYHEDDLSSLINHNFGVLGQSVSERSSKLIEKLGKGNLINPVQMNYMFLVEGLSKETAEKTLIKESVPFSVELSENKKNTLFNQIFGDEDSVKTNVMKNFASNEEKAPFFLYSSHSAKSEHFRDHGVSMNKRNSDKKFEIMDFGNENILRVESDIKKCVNDVFRGAYSVNRQNIAKTNSWDTEMFITEENEKALEDFFRDVCSISKLSKMFKQGNQPNMAVFQIDTVSALEKLLTPEDFALVNNMLEILIERTGSNFEKNFGEQKTFGQVLYTDEHLDQDTTPLEFMEQIEQQRVSNAENRRRRLDSGETIETTTWTPAAYNIVCWFWVVLFFITFYAFGTAASMNIQKDTILYAKFITAHEK